MTVVNRAVRILLVVLICSAAPPARAENVDPAADGSRYVYGENVGWINAEPLGADGPGLQVDDFELTGWLWGEGIGWVSMSCKNTASCDSADYGVTQDGDGSLTGFAWSESAGWINFAPATAGVTIDVATGAFAGRAWGENVGWITFASSGTHPFALVCEWTCDPSPAPPADAPWLTLNRSGEVRLSWSASAGGTGYDVLQGDLGALRSGGGDFGSAATACLAPRLTETSLGSPGVPAAGDGSWFLVRASNCGGDGTYDSGEPSQSGFRDDEIAGSGNDCN